MWFTLDISNLDDNPLELGSIFRRCAMFLPALFGPSSSCDHSDTTSLWQYHHRTLLHLFSCRSNDVVLTLRRPVLHAWRVTGSKQPHQRIGLGMREGLAYAQPCLISTTIITTSPFFLLASDMIFWVCFMPLFLAQACAVVKTVRQIAHIGGWSSIH